MPARKRAKRMSPDRRREKVLDSAVDVIVAQGLSGCKMESIAKQAGVSKPLLYKYFPRLQDLLKALVEREYHYLRRRGLDVFPKDMPYDDIVHRSSLAAMEYLYERGPVIRRIASDPAVASLAHGQDRDERQRIIEYFTRQCIKYGLQKDVASICSIMTVNAPIISAHTLKRSGISARRAAEIWSEFIIGGNKAMLSKFGSRKHRKR
jgi:AcrR family transcriptional regulator